MSNFKPCEIEGTFNAVIQSVCVIQHRFKETEEYEVKINFVTENSEAGAIYLDLSQDYIQAGNNQGKKQVEVSAEILKNFGIDLAAGGLTQIEQLRGKEIQVYGKRNSKGYLVFYLNTARPEKVVNATEAAQKIAALFGTPNVGLPGTVSRTPQMQPISTGNMFLSGGDPF